MAMHLVLLCFCLPGLVAADLRMATYENPGYFVHWPNAYGVAQAKYLGKGVCKAKNSEQGQCLGNDSRCTSSSTEQICKAQQVRCTWKFQEAQHKRVSTETEFQCQIQCSMDAECTGYGFGYGTRASRYREGKCKLYMQEVVLAVGSTTPCSNVVGKGTMKHLHAKYMVPSTFGYKGLENQKSKNYDQFLRSNIDNEHDNRNFLLEDGEDALPFRTMRSDVYTSEQGGTFDLRATMKPGESMLVPLRWNNPHSSELEVNIWIFQGDKPVVVPIKRPTCSGEGYQDNIFKFTVPSDFDKLGSKIPGFKGCNADTKPPCTLQIYAHSVESRTYSIGCPIVVTGHDESQTTSSDSGIEPMTTDPGLDFMHLRDLCRPGFDEVSDIKKAVPRWARLVSDVYNHAYQNSDFSPYSGQQHESISKNLQAAAINKMVSGNRGELGRYMISVEVRKRLAALQTLEDGIYKNYESMANKIIEKFGDQMLASQGMTISAEGDQQVLGKCFRCGEVGSLMRERLTTNTYIPSFQLPKSLMLAAKSMVPAKWDSLIAENGMVQIYMATFADLAPFFYASMSYGILYQGAVLKSTLSTKADSTNFRRKGYLVTGCPCTSRNRYTCDPKKCKYDRGQYGASMAIHEKAKELGCNLESCSSKGYRAPGWCAGGLARPLIRDHTATCVTGECSACSAFFGKTLVIGIPAITSLAREVVASGQAPSSRSTINAYPDSDGSDRLGRPGSNITGENDIWKLAEPKTKPAIPTGSPPAPPADRRRRRRRRRTSAGSARRRSARRRRSGKSRRRGRSSRRRKDAGLAELAKDVAMLQQAE